MTVLNHSVEKIITATSYTSFKGLNKLRFRVVLPDWHEPFPLQLRMEATNPREMEAIGLYHVSRSWHINGRVMDQFTISTAMRPIKVPAGTRLISEELPKVWEANKESNSISNKEWYAYSNGRTAFC